MRRKPFDQINVIPFIDIMLVLLVIVLTTATFIAKGIIPLDLPQASSAIELPLKKIAITITKEGKIYLDKEPITFAILKQKLHTISKKSAVLIRSDKDSRFELFIKVLDILKSQGFTNISVETER